MLGHVGLAGDDDACIGVFALDPDHMALVDAGAGDIDACAMRHQIAPGIA